MGWNGSDAIRQPKSPSPDLAPAKSASKNNLKWLLPVGLVVILAPFVWWLIHATDSGSIDETDARSRKIADKGYKGRNAAEATKTANKTLPTSSAITNAVSVSNNAATATAPKGPKARLIKRQPRKGDIKWLFKNAADREIQCLLDIEPGDEILLPSDYRNFEKQFAKAIREPIEDDPNDTEDERDVRKAVREIREELKQRQAKGENLRDVMLAAQKELVEQGEYKQALKRQLWEIRRDKKHSPQDVLDAVDAVNLMLKDKGIGEMKCPSLWKYQAQRYLKEQAKKEEAK